MISLQEAVELFSVHESYADVCEEKRGSYQRDYIALNEYMNFASNRPERQIYERFPGVSCAYRDAAGREILKYDGIADKENNIPVDDGTVFPACSISKFVTAITVMKLWEQGLCNIDEPVNRYLHKWKLLTSNGNESDAGYCVLQLMIREITNARFEEATAKYVFEPSGLKKTFFATLKEIELREKARNMAAGYDSEDVVIPGKYPQIPDLAASGLWSTPYELMMIAKEFIRAVNGGSPLLRRESANRK